MDYETATLRLTSHANLPGTGLPIEDSFVGSLWLAHKAKGDLCFMDHAENVLSCLRVIKTVLNGPDPDTRNTPANQSIPLKVAYAMSGIICDGIRYHRMWLQNHRFEAETLCTLETVVHKIAYAWDQVLAGDMSDILEGFDYSD